MDQKWCLAKGTPFRGIGSTQVAWQGKHCPGALQSHGSLNPDVVAFLPHTERGKQVAEWAEMGDRGRVGDVKVRDKSSKLFGSGRSKDKGNQKRNK